MASPFASSPAPLFDRLCAAADDSVGPLDARGLQASLARDLADLLGTRSRLPLQRFTDEAGTVLDYGLPDFSALSPRSDDDRQGLKDAIMHAIACFEPRLMHVQVDVDDWTGNAEHARVHLSAAVRIGNELRRIDFTLPAGAAAPGLAGSL